MTSTKTVTNQTVLHAKRKACPETAEESFVPDRIESGKQQRCSARSKSRVATKSLPAFAFSNQTVHVDDDSNNHAHYQTWNDLSEPRRKTLVRFAHREHEKPLQKTTFDGLMSVLQRHYHLKSTGQIHVGNLHGQFHFNKNDNNNEVPMLPAQMPSSSTPHSNATVCERKGNLDTVVPDSALSTSLPLTYTPQERKTHWAPEVKESSQFDALLLYSQKDEGVPCPPSNTIIREAAVHAAISDEEPGV